MNIVRSIRKIEPLCSSFSRIEIDDSKELLFERKVVLSDLDIVNHVNNVKYLEWCLDVVDETIMLNKSIGSLDMNFLKELPSLAEVVEIHESNREPNCF